MNPGLRSLFQAAQKAPEARRRGARNEAYFACTPQLRATTTTKQMDFLSSLLDFLIRVEQLLIFVKGEPVGHARDIIADGALNAVLLHRKHCLWRQELRLPGVNRKEVPYNSSCLGG